MSQLLLTAVGGAVNDTVSLDLAPERAPGAGEVVIAVEATPINGADLLFAAGWFALYPQVPAAMGAEGVGRILAVGSQVDPALVGRRVLILPTFHYGTWATRTVVPAQNVIPVAEHVDPLQPRDLSSRVFHSQLDSGRTSRAARARLRRAPGTRRARRHRRSRRGDIPSGSVPEGAAARTEECAHRQGPVHPEWSTGRNAHCAGITPIGPLRDGGEGLTEFSSRPEPATNVAIFRRPTAVSRSPYVHDPPAPDNCLHARTVRRRPHRLRAGPPEALWQQRRRVPKVHHRGASEADVTEGSGGVWERLHYDWSDPTRVVMRTTDSNVWGGASGHTYTFTRRPDGRTDLDAVVVREGKNLKGRLLGLVLGTIGKRVLTRAFENTVKAIEARNAGARVANAATTGRARREAV